MDQIISNNISKKKNIAAAIIFFFFYLSINFHSHASSTGVVYINGYIASLTEITVTAEMAANNLDFNTSVNNLLVGIVLEKSNIKSGYKVTVSSANNGKFKGQLGDNNDSIGYILKYDGQNFNLNNSSFSPLIITNSTSRTPRDGVIKQVSISYTPTGFINADSYSDVLTFTISSNN